jgi:CopG family nickel-responsive transcriptional regulator
MSWTMWNSAMDDRPQKQDIAPGNSVPSPAPARARPALKRRARNRPVTRISMSLPEGLLNDLDRMVAARGFESRSQAINDVLYQTLMEHKRELGDGVMAGVITLSYDNSVSGLQKGLADLQFRYIDEVISSLHVHLMHNQTMEVLLVQGPARKLQAIADEMTSRRGVISGKIHLIAALIPQVHPFIQNAKQARGAAS